MSPLADGSPVIPGNTYPVLFVSVARGLFFNNDYGHQWDILQNNGYYSLGPAYGSGVATNGAGWGVTMDLASSHYNSAGRLEWTGTLTIPASVPPGSYSAWFYTAASTIGQLGDDCVFNFVVQPGAGGGGGTGGSTSNATGRDDDIVSAIVTATPYDGGNCACNWTPGNACAGTVWTKTSC